MYTIAASFCVASIGFFVTATVQPKKYRQRRAIIYTLSGICMLVAIGALWLPNPQSEASISISGGNSGNACTGNAKCSQEAPKPTCAVSDQGGGHFTVTVNSPYPARSLRLTVNGIQLDPDDTSVPAIETSPGPDNSVHSIVGNVSSIVNGSAWKTIQSPSGDYLVTVYPMRGQTPTLTCTVD